ncbi:heterokaryon incompatibility protein-domain-containing protein [Trametes gibbosa]|nr:heterokaryon incompatibility protein-domain-containing protein [Trametes gibbosa]
MPRFLDTWTGEFVWKNDPSNVRYAILSHTWQYPEDGGEQTYADIVKLHSEITEAVDGTHNLLPSKPEYAQPDTVNTRVPSPFFFHPQLSEKVAMACKVARETGYDLLWIDSCCIDKSSSAELAEAINSMFQWYRLSSVCYAFLADVPDSDDPTQYYSRFWRSRWHKRGWTLQELIASERLIFLTKTWTFMGTKMGLATTIEHRTGVDFDILVGRARVDSVSVARRMSWAAGRQTTRIEDGAYSLLGIFGVHMAPIYGEGENAFLRLQEEILRTVPDQTIFAWNHPGSRPGLLATDPLFFCYSGDFSVTSPAEFASRLHLQIEDVPPLHAVVTPQGVRIKLLCVDLDRFVNIAQSIQGLKPLPEKYTCDDCSRLPRAHLLAILQCQNREGDLLALPLRQPPPGVGKGLHVESQADCTHTQFWTGSQRVLVLREIALGKLLMHQSLFTVSVSILHHPLLPSTSISMTSADLRKGFTRSWLEDVHSAVDFEYNSDSVRELDKLGFSLTPLTRTRSPAMGTMLLSFTLSSYSICRPWTADLPRHKVAINVSCKLDENGQVDVAFSASNFTFGPLPDFDASISSSTFETDSIIPASIVHIPTSLILDTASGAYVTEGRSTSNVNFDHEPPSHIFARAEFAVYAGAGVSELEERGDGTVRIRWLKLAIGRSIERPDERLCIAIELSDVHKHSTPSGCTHVQRYSNLGASSSEDDIITSNVPSPLVQQPTIQMLADTVNTLCRKNAELTSRIDMLSAQNTALCAQMADLLKHVRVGVTIENGTIPVNVCVAGDTSPLRKGLHPDPDILRQIVLGSNTGTDATQRGPTPSGVIL